MFQQLWILKCAPPMASAHNKNLVAYLFCSASESNLPQCLPKLLQFNIRHTEHNTHFRCLEMPYIFSCCSEACFFWQRQKGAFTKLVEVIAHYGVDEDRHLHKMTQPITKNRPMNTIYGYKRHAYKVLLRTRDMWRHSCGNTLDVKAVRTRDFSSENLGSKLSKFTRRKTIKRSWQIYNNRIFEGVMSSFPFQNALWSTLIPRLTSDSVNEFFG